MLRWSLHEEYLSEISLCRREKEEAGIGRGRSQTKVLARQVSANTRGVMKEYMTLRAFHVASAAVQVQVGEILSRGHPPFTEIIPKGKEESYDNYSNKTVTEMSYVPGMVHSIVHVLTHLKLTTTL